MTRGGVPARICDDVTAVGILGEWIARDELEQTPRSKGAYILFLRLSEPIRLDTPRIASGRLRRGWYLYVGSAWGSGGIRGRLRRHFRPDKKMHWHVDRLTVRSSDIAALVLADSDECELVSQLLGSRRFDVAVAGFGNSDCRSCESHLLSCTSGHKSTSDISSRMRHQTTPA